MDIALILSQERPSTLISKMDISTVLNQPELDPMEVDTPTSALFPFRSSPDSSPSISISEFPSPLLMQASPHRLPSIDDLSAKKAESQTHHSCNSLPPLRSLFEDFSLPTVDRHEFCSQMVPLHVHHEAYPHRQYARIHRRHSTERIIRDFHEHEIRSLLRNDHTRSDLARRRRRSHHSGISPGSPRHQTRIFRRGSHPQSIWNVPIDRTLDDGHRYRQPVILVEARDTHYDSVSPPKKGTHNNKAYTKEQCMWIRYHKVDRGMEYKTMLPLFHAEFPDRYDPLATGQTLSSRTYRDNDRPWLDENGAWGLDEKGKLKMVQSKVRHRNTAEGKELAFPYTLVDKWPAMVLEYQWKSPILEEDKEKARQILAGNDPCDPQGSKLIYIFFT
jgi:hypothetical protein